MNWFVHPRRPGAGFKGGNWYGLRFGRWSFGFEHSLIWRNEAKYLERWIMYIGAFTLRLHKFWAGDDDRAPHDHPFWFITFPLRSYVEDVYEDYWLSSLPPRWKPRIKVVRAFRPHFRPASHKHIVIGALHGPMPFYTIVLSKFIQPEWGFWPDPDTFVHFTKWNDYNATTN
jgi:hypothetical protein